MADDSDPIITPQDIRDAGHCAVGFKDWMAAHNLPLVDFYAGKIKASQFLATGDANGIKVVQRKLAKRK